MEESRRIGIGNISLENGRQFDNHKSHRNGLQADIDQLDMMVSREVSLTKIQHMTGPATQKLVDLLWATGQVKQIFFKDPQIKGVKPLKGHDNHLHVDVKAQP